MIVKVSENKNVFFTTTAISCLNPWHQIGESCYLKVDEQVKADEAERACRDRGSELAHVPSLAAYDAFKRFIFNTGDDIDTYWIGAKKTRANERNITWHSIQLQQSTWVSSTFYALEMVFSETKIAMIGLIKCVFENSIHSACFYLFMIQYSQLRI